MLRKVSSLSGSMVAALVSCAIAVACSGSANNSGFDKGSSGSSGSGEADGGLGSSGSSGSSGTFGDAAAISPDAACASDTVKAQQQPLDMYIMLDQSGSMNDSNKWTSVTTALKSFLTQPTAAGLGVGIQYFGLPPGSAGCPTTCANSNDCNGNGTCLPFINKCSGCLGGGGASSCNGADYAVPEIEIAPLPGSAQALTASINAHSPSTGTPTSAALQGAVDHAKTWATAHAGHVTIAVFATDGDPSECDTNLTNIDAIASTAAAGNPKILTFVIGVGSSLANLNGIAAAGGTGQAFLVDTNGNTTQQFLDALNKIRGTALGCQYQIPAAKNGGTLDYGTVNVRYTPGGGGPSVTIPKVADVGHCPATGDAWYYDNNTKPTQILLCGTSCKTVTADTKGDISIVVGCSTILK